MQVCEALGLDPAVYFTETDPKRNAYRDAAMTVIVENRRAQAEEQDRQRRIAALTKK